MDVKDILAFSKLSPSDSNMQSRLKTQQEPDNDIEGSFLKLFLIGENRLDPTEAKALR